MLTIDDQQRQEKPQVSRTRCTSTRWSMDESTCTPDRGTCFQYGPATTSKTNVLQVHDVALQYAALAMGVQYWIVTLSMWLSLSGGVSELVGIGIATIPAIQGYGKVHARAKVINESMDLYKARKIQGVDERAASAEADAYREQRGVSPDMTNLDVMFVRTLITYGVAKSARGSASDRRLPGPWRRPEYPGQPALASIIRVPDACGRPTRSHR
jgi:hypothetical protein